MADKSTSFKLGECRGDKVKTEVVEYTDTVVPGDFLKITDKREDGMMKVAKQTSHDTNADYIVPLQEGGESGDIRVVVCEAEAIKVTFGGAVSEGSRLYVSGNKAVPSSTAQKGNYIGFSRVSATNNDTGIISFKGGLA